MTVFAAIDHSKAECVGIHVVKKATRFEALELIRQRVKEECALFWAALAPACGCVMITAAFAVIK